VKAADVFKKKGKEKKTTRWAASPLLRKKRQKECLKRRLGPNR
jgi:hypothetical protein